MPQKVIKFKGINRDVNEFQTSGECEELINLRPKIGGGHRVVRPKKVIRAGVPYVRLYEHTFGDVCNQIAVTEDGSVDWISKDGSIANLTRAFTSSELSISSAGNILLIYCAEDNTQLAFKFENNEYADYSVSVPLIKLSVSLTDFTASATYTSDSVTGTLSEGRDVLSKAYSNFYNGYPHGLAGPIIVGCTFELEDGNEVWSSGFTIIDPTKDENYVDATCTGITATVHGAKYAKLNFEIQNYSSVVGVKNIKFYSSLPLASFDLDDTSGIGGTLYPIKKSSTDINIAGQAMYLQRVVSFRRVGEFNLDTEYKIAGNELMPVTAGAIYRSGDTVSYNNRFHFFGSDVEHPIQNMSNGVHSNITLPEESNYVNIKKAKLYVVINNGEEEIFIGEPGSFNVQIGTTRDFIYPMGGIKKGYLRTSDDEFKTSIWYEIDFSDSTAYNYSCALDYLISTPCNAPEMDNYIEAHGQTILWRKEPNAINVSAQYNPFIFPVEYSYSFSGEIRDIATSYLPISSTQVGQYPLTVFTSSGVFSMEQGNGEVLYSNIVPLQPLVIDGKSTATPFGTFFISSRNLFLLSGRDIANVSFVLNGERELNLRDLDSYRKLVCNTSGVFYNYEPMLSGEDFEDFIEDAHLTYDQLQNELYISSSKPEIPYSYVFNLDTKSYHKVIKKYLNSQSGSRYVIETIGDDKKIVDLFIEEKSVEPIFLQSRPMPLEAVYTHIQRLILLADAALKDEQYLCISVFGSDNLYDWKCITSSQKSNIVFRQIRTNRAAKSNKDYVVVITGDVDTNTDISDIIADYTVVNRRLG